MSDSLPVPNPTGKLSREDRLNEIRRQVEREGRLEIVGDRPAGAPFPQASAENGYYRIPLLKEAPWTWEIPPVLLCRRSGRRCRRHWRNSELHWCGSRTGA